MTAQELFRAGKLNEAVQALGVEVRDNPTDVRRRTFLFELLCFQGEYDRAEKHLNVLADATPDAEVGAMLVFLGAARRTAAAGDFSKERLPDQCPHWRMTRGGHAEREAIRILRGRRSAGGCAPGSFRGRRLFVDSAGACRVDRTGGAETSPRSVVGSGAGAHRAGF